MGRETAARHVFHNIERVLLAWEAVRLDPDYRRDWNENLPYMRWWKTASATDRLNHPISQWLKKIAMKWEFAPGKLLLDPDCQIPFYSGRELANCFKTCTPRCRRNKSGTPKNCWARYLEMVMPCPFAWENPLGVFRECPLRPLFDTGQARLGGKLRLAMLFDKLERQADRAVCWIPSTGMSRRGLDEQIMKFLSVIESERKAAKTPCWDKPHASRRLLRTFKADDLWVLSINIRGSKRRTFARIKKSLARIPISPFSRKANDLWEGFTSYAHTEHGGLSTKDLCIKKYGEEAGEDFWKKHRERRKEGENGAIFRQIRRELALARGFIKQKKFRTLVPDRNLVFQWKMLSPQSPPPLPKST